MEETKYGAQIDPEREDLMMTIDSHYPADTHYRGPEILMKAICDEWRSLPTPILRRYAQLCLAEERYGS